MTLLLGDCLERLKELEDNSVDACVTDPPYGLAFMGKKWDYDVPSEAIWREVLRVLKPGGHLLSFAGTRTYHRMVVRIEDAGFEIRDQLQWLYGQGFPKSLDISKALDKMAGITEWKETTPNPAARPGNGEHAATSTGWAKPQRPPKPVVQTEAAKQWAGWGTALKPANEPICLARKPISEKNIAENVLRWNTGALNIDASRIPSSESTKRPLGSVSISGTDAGKKIGGSDNGRFPSNLLLDETVAAALDAQVGFLHGPGNKKPADGFKKTGSMFGGPGAEGAPAQIYDRGGSASRFFYVAKVSAGERNAGLEEMPDRKVWAENRESNSNDIMTMKRVNSRTGKLEERKAPTIAKNHHPTVKPIKLMEYLCRLVTPPNGVVLDPFAGSGSTLVAAKRLGLRFVGIEREPEYHSIAKARVEACTT